MITKNIGGQMEMNSRYYIRKGKLYPTYNRRRYSKPVKALRKEEVDSAFFRIRLLTVITILALLITIIAGFIISNNIKRLEREFQISKIENNNTMIDSVMQDIKTETVEVSIDEEFDSFSDTSTTNSVMSHREVNYEVNVLYRDTNITNNIPNDNTSVMNLVSYNNNNFIKMDLPSKYYPDIDYSSFQPGEPYQKITNKQSPAYSISYSENAYTDENGLRRYIVDDNQFKIDGQDDYIVGMGTFYKTKGTAGERFLITTSTSSFTIIMGDEKADVHTDKMNMFTLHNGKAGIIEFIYDEETLHKDILAAGTFFNGPDPVLSGKITGIYKIV